ncbi:hypothetical protein HYV71_03305 [Candidatus Uhrbacteria bacterium]|nr:hypothetical protein [Candidatus Uhrbacteria bacterium]
MTETHTIHRIARVASTVVVTCLMIGMFFVPNIVATAYAQSPLPKEPDFYLQFPIGELTNISAKDFAEGKSIPRYITAVYQWMVGIVTILAVIALMVGGVIWMLAGGSKGRMDTAKKTITNAIVGLVLALGSYLFLWTISPQLVQFKPILLPVVEEIHIDTCPPIESSKFSSGIAISTFSSLKFDDASKRAVEKPGIIAQKLISLIQKIDEEGFSLTIITEKKGSKFGYSDHTTAADFFGTEEELERLKAYVQNKLKKEGAGTPFYFTTERGKSLHVGLAC